MGKKLKNPIECKIIAHFEDGPGEFHIADVSIHYGVTCEHGLSDRFGHGLDKNQEILNIVKDFLEEGIKQVEVLEVIAPVDSMLDANGDAHYIPE